ncbi:hypothetical protein Tco_0435803 [Tanacetum coccineum]
MAAVNEVPQLVDKNGDLLVKEKIESQSETSQTVFALKLLVLKTGEYDLWSMRMKQYLTFTDHALWEVIVNGDSVSPVASASTSAEGPIPPKTAKQKLARKNELKAKSTLMLAVPDEHLLKFHAFKDAKSRWEAIKNRYEAEIKGQSSSSSNSHNVAFVSSENTSSTNEAVNTAHEVSTANLEQIDTNDLEEIDLKWQVAMLTIRVKRFLKKTGRNLNFNGKETVSFDKTKESRNRNRDAPRRIVLVETPANTLVVQDGIGYQMVLESLEARIVVHEKNESFYEKDIAFLKYDVQVKDISIKDNKNQLEEALKEKDDLKLKLEKFEESLKNLNKLINS